MMITITSEKSYNPFMETPLVLIRMYS